MHASMLIKPVLSAIIHHISESSFPSYTDAYKVLRLLDFLVSLLEHTHGKVLLLREGTLQMLTKLLDRYFVIIDVDGKQIPDRCSAKCSFNIFSWCLPIFKFIMLLFHSETSQHYPRRHDL